MAIIAAWSYDDSSTMAHRSLSLLSGTTCDISSAAPRTGIRSLRLVGGSTPGRVAHPFAGVATGSIMGAAFGYRPGYSTPSLTPSGSNSYFVAGFYENGTQHTIVGLDSSGMIQIRRAGSTINTGTVIAPVFQSVYSHWEIKYICHDTMGSIVVRINGVEYFSLSSVDTRNGGSGVPNQFVVASQSNSNAISSYCDDTVIWDTSGSDITDWVGDVEVLYIAPSGAGNYSQWAPSTGANYANVDDIGAPDDDTTYNSEATASDKDTFVNSGIGGGTIKAVQTVLRARKTAAGSKTIRPMFRIGGTDYFGTNISVSDGYTSSTEIFHNDPSDSNDWTSTDITNLEHGYEMVS